MPETDHTDIGAGYEPDDLQVRTLLGIAATVLISLLVVVTVAWWLTGWFSRITPGADRGATPAPVAAPQPHLQPQPQLDLARHRAAKLRLLTGYAWIDRKDGTVRISIERAMDLMAQRAEQRREGP